MEIMSPSDNSNIKSLDLTMDETEKFQSLLSQNVLGRLYPYIPLFLLVLIFTRKVSYSEYGKKSNAPSMDTLLSVQRAIKKTDMKNALSSICSYLNEEEQIPIHRLAGALQAVDIIQKVMDNSYRIHGLPSTAFSNRDEKQLGIIRTLKDHAHEGDKNLLEVVESILDTMNKVKKITQETKSHQGFHTSKINSDEILQIVDTDKTPKIIEDIKVSNLSSN